MDIWCLLQFHICYTQTRAKPKAVFGKNVIAKCDECNEWNEILGLELYSSFNKKRNDTHLCIEQLMVLLAITKVKQSVDWIDSIEAFKIYHTKRLILSGNLNQIDV